MKILTFVLGDLQTNCYLAICEKTKECLIIDPADEADFISEKILSLNLKPIAILATHCHFDHLLAAKELPLNFNLPFLCHKNEEKILKYMKSSANWWLKRKIFEEPPEVEKFLKNKERIKFGEDYLTVTHTPGHTPGSVCFYNLKEKVVFTGDTIFSESFVGRTDFLYGSKKDLQDSLKTIFRKFSGFTAYPGHGEKFTISN